MGLVLRSVYSSVHSPQLNPTPDHCDDARLEIKPRKARMSLFFTRLDVGDDLGEEVY